MHYAILSLITLLIGGLSWYHIDELNESIDSKNKTILELNHKIEARDSLINGEYIDRHNYLEKLRIAENENDRLRACIADKSCLPRVRVLVSSACPGTNSATGTETTEAELGKESQEDFLRLMDEIRVYDAMYDLCINTLETWSKNSRLNSVAPRHKGGNTTKNHQSYNY